MYVYILYKYIYLSALKKEILPFATTLKNLEDIMLSKIRQTQKEKNCTVSLIHVESKNLESIETESRTVVARGWGWRKCEEAGQGYKAAITEDD